MTSRRKTSNDYHNLAKSRGFSWLGPDLPERVIEKTLWQCKLGHQWETSYNKIQSGRGCSICAGNAKKTVNDYQVLAASREMAWVASQIPKNVSKPTEWECSQGHQWKESYTNIRRGYGCAVCNGVAKKTQKDYLELASARGFTWLESSLPKNTLTATNWKCNKNHTWSASFNSIQTGSGCPTCAGNKPKNKNDYMLLAKKRGFIWSSNSLPKNSQTPTEWICSHGHRFQSRYHSIARGAGCPTCYRLKKPGLSTVRKTSRDYHKLAAIRGFEWLGDVEPDNIRASTIWQCGEGHIWNAKYRNINRGSNCPTCKGTRKKNELDYQLLAEKMGIKWLGTELPKNVSTPTDWNCSHGHQWRARYSSLARGLGCPFCAGNAPKIELDYYVLAELRGFEWIGDQLPKTVLIKTLWMCEKHHVWKSTYDSIRRGNGCPQCASTYPKDIQDYTDLAKAKGLKWVGGKLPKNIRTKTTWECRHRHRFEANYNYVHNGKKCPTCRQIDRP